MEDIKNKNIMLEFEGRTVKEAVNKALAVLKVDKKYLNIKVLSEEQKGLFGMKGAKQAKIRVTLLKSPVKKKP